MVGFQPAKPIKETITEEVRAEEEDDHEDPKEETFEDNEETEDKESDEGNESFQEESISQILELFAIKDEAKKKMGSSSRTGEFSNHRESEFVSDMYRQRQSYEENCSLVTQPPEEIVGLDSLFAQLPFQNQNFTTNSELASLGMQQQQSSPLMLTTRPRSFAAGLSGPISAPWRPQNTYQQHPVVNQMANTVPVSNQTIVSEPAFVDHNYAAGFGQNHAPWRHQIRSGIMPFMPNQTVVQGPAFVDHNYAPWRSQNIYQLPPMVMMGMPNQNIVRGPAFFVDQNYFNRPFGMQQQHYPNTAAPMMYTVPNLVRGQAPMMYQQGQQFLRPETNQQDQIVPNLFMRPETNQQNQMGTFPFLIPRQAPMMYQQEQQFMRPETYQQNQMGTFPFLIPRQAPMMYQQEQQFMRPETNQQNQMGIFPFLIPRQAPTMYHPQLQVRSVETMTVAPSGWQGSYVVNQNYFNQQQLHIDMIQQASANAAAETATWPELNQQQMSQLQSQTQQPTQSQGFNAGPSSEF